MALSYVENFKGIFNGSIASTSTATGTIVVTGGIGVSGAVNSGSVSTGALAASGAVTMTQGTASTSTGTGTLVVTGGVGVSGAVNSGSVGTGALAASGAVTMTAGTASTSTGTGTLVVTGGVGVSGTIRSTQSNAGNIQIAGNTMSSTDTNGDIVFSPNGTGLVKIGSNEVATKAYVDASIQGLDVKQSVKVATTTAGTLATSFANGQSIDGYTLVTGDRILIKNQSTASENGIYTVNASGAPTRAVDADVNADVTAGLFTFVEQGTANADTGWVLTSDGPVTLGTTGLTFVQFSSAGVVTAGDGLTKNGNTLSANLTINGGLVIESGAIAVNLGASGITGTLAVADGGTGATTLTGYVYGNGTDAMTASTTIPGSAITGSVNNVSIGSTTRSSAAFTTLAASGAVTMTANAASTSTGTGTLVVTGGVGISGTMNSGSVGTGALAASGAVTMTQNTASTSTGTGSLLVTGGVGVGGQVTAQSLSVADQFNTGVSLSTNSWSTGELVVRSNIVDLKTVAETNLFTVPTGYMFLVDSMEIVTTSITGAGAPPSVRFGISTLPADHYEAARVTSNSVGARHIIDNPQDAAVAGSVISFGVTAGSTASAHSGCAIVRGYLFKTS